MLTVQTVLEDQLLIKSEQTYVFKKEKTPKNKKYIYSNEFIQKLEMGDTTTFFYQFIYNVNYNGETKKCNILLCMEWDYESR